MPPPFTIPIEPSLGVPYTEKVILRKNRKNAPARVETIFSAALSSLFHGNPLRKNRKSATVGVEPPSYDWEGGGDMPTTKSASLEKPGIILASDVPQPLKSKKKKKSATGTVETPPHGPEGGGDVPTTKSVNSPPCRASCIDDLFVLRRLWLSSRRPVVTRRSSLKGTDDTGIWSWIILDN